jgi:hypothetical protein
MIEVFTADGIVAKQKATPNNTVHHVSTHVIAYHRCNTPIQDPGAHCVQTMEIDPQAAFSLRDLRQQPDSCSHA